MLRILILAPLAITIVFFSVKALACESHGKGAGMGSVGSFFGHSHLAAEGIVAPHNHSSHVTASNNIDKQKRKPPKLLFDLNKKKESRSKPPFPEL